MVSYGKMDRRLNNYQHIGYYFSRNRRSGTLTGTGRRSMIDHLVRVGDIDDRSFSETENSGFQGSYSLRMVCVWLI